MIELSTLLQISQAISKTIDLDELLQMLTQTILQNSGGDRCVLILPDKQGEWFVRTIATPTKTQLCSEPLENNLHLPVKLIQYVKNTQEVVAIDDLKTNLPVLEDYLIQQHPQSIFCSPILNQGHLIGILYLHNRCISGMFTRYRVILLNFLCTQAAISLENARLYQESHQYTQELQNSLIQLQQSELRFKEIFNKSKDAILLLGDQEFIDCNRSAVKLFGYSQIQELCSIHPSEISPEFQFNGLSSFDQANAMITMAFQNGRHQFEWLHKQLNGGVFWAEVTLTLIPCDGKQVLYYLVRDISDRKKSEALIQQKSQELEKTLQELQQSQLKMIQSEKMSALGNLVAGIAHEMNNPLGFISASLQQAKSIFVDIIEHLKLYQEIYANPGAKILDHREEIDLDYVLEDLPKILDSMVIACDRLTNVSTSLRTFSRADQDYKVLFAIHEGIDSTIMILKHRLKANEQRPAIKVVTNYGNIPAINCFSGQLNQVFMNILANAIDALDEANQEYSYAQIKESPNCITITTSIENNQVRIAIADNGIGMTEVVKQKIFEHLYTTKEVGKGTGLGLAIAQQIVVEKHRGKLDLESTLGQGTTFIITLPIS